MKVVAVLDYGMSNLHSVNRALEHVAGREWHVAVSNQASMLHTADKVVFPGQGAMGNAMALLRETGLDQAVREALQHKPFLGICLGLQTLLTYSEENQGVDGLGITAGQVRRFATNSHDAAGNKLKIPQMGWNQVEQTADHPLWRGIPNGSRFYFVHSYYADPEDRAIVIGTTHYPDPYASAIAFGNVAAVQFHPEKSQSAGLRLLRNFLAL